MLYKAALLSAVQQRESAVDVGVPLPLGPHSPCGLLLRVIAEHRAPCASQRPPARARFTPGSVCTSVLLSPLVPPFLPHAVSTRSFSTSVSLFCLLMLSFETVVNVKRRLFMSKRALPMFSSKSFRVSGLTFRSLIHTNPFAKQK